MDMNAANAENSPAVLRRSERLRGRIPPVYFERRKKKCGFLPKPIFHNGHSEPPFLYGLNEGRLYAPHIVPGEQPLTFQVFQNLIDESDYKMEYDDSIPIPYPGPGSDFSLDENSNLPSCSGMEVLAQDEEDDEVQFLCEVNNSSTDSEEAVDSPMSPQEPEPEQQDNNDVQVVFEHLDPNYRPSRVIPCQFTIVQLMKHFFRENLDSEGREELRCLLSTLKPFQQEMFFFYSYRRAIRYFSREEVERCLDFDKLPKSSLIHECSNLCQMNEDDGLSIRFYGREVRNRMMQRNKKCAICLIDFEIDNLLRTLPCFHEYHVACADLWLEKSASCPTCRALVDLRDLSPQLITYYEV